MRRLVMRWSVLFFPLALAGWAGCSSTSSEGTDTADAGSDAPPPPPPAPPDAGPPPPPPRDCTNDVQADGLATHLECSGLYASFAQKTIAPSIRPYVPGLEFWSDGAAKSRFLYLPPGTKIDTSTFDEWRWPNGTKVWKEFKVDGKRIETRLFAKGTDGVWKRTTYRWNAAEDDAKRLDAGEKIPRPGKPSYEVPSVGLCDECHSGRADALLGLEPVSLGLPTATGVTLASLSAEGLLSTTPPRTSLTIPDDPVAAVGNKAPPALGWLHVNCGVCHNASTNATAHYTNLFFLIKASQLVADGGVATLDTYATAKCKKSPDRQNADAGAGVFWTYVAGGSPGTSLVSVLSNQRAVEPDFPTTANQMPPVVTHLQDVAGHALLDAWITALPVCP